MRCRLCHVWAEITLCACVTLTHKQGHVATLREHHIAGNRPRSGSSCCGACGHLGLCWGSRNHSCKIRNWWVYTPALTISSSSLCKVVIYGLAEVSVGIKLSQKARKTIILWVALVQFLEIVAFVLSSCSLSAKPMPWHGNDQDMASIDKTSQSWKYAGLYNGESNSLFIVQYSRSN